MRRTDVALPPLVFSIAMAMAITGCFTEVGNPDDPAVAVSTRFTIDYQSRPAVAPKVAAALPEEGIIIDHFRMAVYEAEYFKGGKLQFLKDSRNQDWNNMYGNVVDFTGRDTAAKLPALSATLGALELFYFTIRTDTAVPPVVPDSMDYAGFQSRMHLRGSILRQGGNLDFLFEIPTMRRLFLILRDTSLEARSTSEGLRLDVAFRALYFRAGIPWDSLATVKDRMGRPFALVSPKSNARFYDRLKAGFLSAFDVDKAQVDGEHPLPGK